MKFQSVTKTKAMFTYGHIRYRTDESGVFDTAGVKGRKQDALIRHLKSNSFFTTVSPAHRVKSDAAPPPVEPDEDDSAAEPVDENTHSVRKKKKEDVSTDAG